MEIKKLNKKLDVMGTQGFFQMEDELRHSYKFEDLGFKPWNISRFIGKNPGKSPYQLVYQTENGETEVDDTIREDVSKLIGFELYDKEHTYVVLIKTIKAEDLPDVKTVTVGELREIAKKIHPEAIPINDYMAALMWYYPIHYYTLNFLLKKKGIELPDIQVLSSIKSGANDNERFIDWNSSCGYWEYLDGDGGSGVIEWHLPVWCYYVKK